MANTIKETNRTIEISAIDSDYVMDTGLNVESVVFVPGAVNDTTEILEVQGAAIAATDLAKVTFLSGDGEPRVWYTSQRLRLGFDFLGGTFSVGSKVIFNVGDRNY